LPPCARTNPGGDGMLIDFTGKKAIVCGGSRGIGRAIALGFAGAGGDVSICARDATTLEHTRADIAKHGHKAHAAHADLALEAEVRGYIRAAADALGGVDFLVNNASAFGSSDDEKGWTSSLAIDMMAIVHATQEALPALKASKGSVLNISSIAAMHTAARQPPYGAIKAAAIHYTGSQAAMYAKDGIRVNCIAPGSIEFPGGVWDRRKSENPRLYNAVLSSIPFGRLGHPEEIANVALFLASPLAAWVTGQTIAVDGGQLL
jgi:3-oxoacyl-[acyl-carrier protein] reductase